MGALSVVHYVLRAFVCVLRIRVLQKYACTGEPDVCPLTIISKRCGCDFPSANATTSSSAASTGHKVHACMLVMQSCTNPSNTRAYMAAKRDMPRPPTPALKSST